MLNMTEAFIVDVSIQLLFKIFLDSDFCHNYLHTPVVLIFLTIRLILQLSKILLHEMFNGHLCLN